MCDVGIAPVAGKDKEVACGGFDRQTMLWELDETALWRVQIQHAHKISLCCGMVDYVCVQIESIVVLISLHTEFFEESGTRTHCVGFGNVLDKRVGVQASERVEQIRPSIAMARQIQFGPLWHGTLISLMERL